MKNFIVVLVIIAVFILGYGIVSKNKTGKANPPAGQTANQPTSPPAASEESQPTSAAIQQEGIAVTYGDEGFAPASLTVAADTTVTFTNKTGAPMWVASDPHPAHSNLPEFDQKQSASRGESYAFTFEKKGPFRYHNHLSPSDRGVIVVE